MHFCFLTILGPSSLWEWHRFPTILQCWAICILELETISLQRCSHSLLFFWEYDSTCTKQEKFLQMLLLNLPWLFLGPFNLFLFVCEWPSPSTSVIYKLLSSKAPQRIVFSDSGTIESFFLSSSFCSLWSINTAEFNCRSVCPSARSLYVQVLTVCNTQLCESIMKPVICEWHLSLWDSQFAVSHSEAPHYQDSGCIVQRQRGSKGPHWGHTQDGTCSQIPCLTTVDRRIGKNRSGHDLTFSFTFKTDGLTQNPVQTCWI